MMQEDYVSFEVAKLLKEKGFDVPIHTFYNLKNIYLLKIDSCQINRNAGIHVSAPTLQIAMKWLREEYNIFIHISITQKSMYDSINELVFGEPEYNYKIEHLYSYEENYGRESYDSYEKACEAAIKYVLENLIKK